MKLMKAQRRQISKKGPQDSCNYLILFSFDVFKMDSPRSINTDIWQEKLICSSIENILFNGVITSTRCSIKETLFMLGCERILRHSHIRPALDHFWAIWPDSHSTISIIAWYLPLKNWNLYYVFAHLLAIWPFLSLFDPTRTWLFHYLYGICH